MKLFEEPSPAPAKAKAAPEPALEAPAVPAAVATATSRRRETAESLAARQREISVSEFFTKNRHLLGFDNPAKALLTAIKEAVDNSLDACEEAGIPPDLEILIQEISEDRFRITVGDNGPGIVKNQIPRIFGKLLYGSKFHVLKQSRGQQGIGISAAGMYSQLTTGKPVRIVSRTGKGKPAHSYEIQIDTRKNNPEVISEGTAEWAHDHGTSVEMELQATYKKGRRSVDATLPRRRWPIRTPRSSIAIRRARPSPTRASRRSCRASRWPSSRIPTVSSWGCCSRC
jgi:DNA topoisomerase-6 subunit B